MSEQYNPLNHIMDIEAASKKWNLSNSTIKNMCIHGNIQIKCIKLGGVWILDKNQPRPILPSEKK